VTIPLHDLQRPLYIYMLPAQNMRSVTLHIGSQLYHPLYTPPTLDYGGNVLLRYTTFTD